MIKYHNRIEYDIYINRTFNTPDNYSIQDLESRFQLYKVNTAKISTIV